MFDQHATHYGVSDGPPQEINNHVLRARQVKIIGNPV
jgi:hypothetical protein